MVHELISVIMPAYNAAATIEQSARSVLEQSYEHIELIIVDDGSDDATSEICAALAQEDHRVIYHRSSNGGVSRARNTGISLAKGAYIAFLDSDDLYEKEKLLKQYSVIKTKDVDVVTTGIRRFAESAEGIQWLRESFPPDLRANPYLTLLLRTTTDKYVIFNTALVKREIFDRGVLYDPELKTGEDWDIWVRLARFCRFAAVDEALFFYRKHTGSVTAGYGSLKTLRTHIGILRKNYSQEVPLPEFQERIDGKYLEFIGNAVYSGNILESVRLFLTSMVDSTAFKRKRFYELAKDLLFKSLDLALGRHRSPHSRVE